MSYSRQSCKTKILFSLYIIDNLAKQILYKERFFIYYYQDELKYGHIIFERYFKAENYSWILS